MKMRIFSGLIAAATLSGPAFAADLPTKASGNIAAPQPIQWTGFYVGGHIGVLWDRENRNTTAPLAEVYTQSGRGRVAGFHAGYDYQWAPNALIGVEGSYSTVNLSNDAPSILVPTSHYHTTVDWLATATARIGYVSGSWLLYARGGYAATDVTFVGTTVGDYVSVGGTRHGWTLGGGIEYMVVRNFSIGIEYDHFDFGTKNYVSRTLGGFPLNADVGFKLDRINVRASYRFGG